MELRPGYKQTEVGVIPEDWEVCRLDSLGAGTVPPIKAGPFGSSLTKDTYVPTGYKVYGQEQVIRGDYLYGDYYISHSKYQELESCAVSPGDVLLSLVGTAGKLLVVPDDAPAGVINPRLIRFSFDKKRVCPQFFKDLFETGQVQSFLARYAQGGTMGVLNAGMLRPISISLPPLPEQRVIAAVRSDVDDLIAKIDQLIAKKRDIKQAAMQQLLTGHKRLPGFHGEWKASTLKQAAEISTGINKPISEMGSGTLYVTVQDLYDGTSIQIQRLGRIRVSPLEVQAKALVVSDIVLGKSSVKRDGIGFPSRFLGSKEPVVFSGFTYRARARQGIADATFLFYALRWNKTRQWLVDNSQASALTNINQSIVDAIPVPLPSVPEQTAIASVLSDMDAEIAALEARRDKTRDLKQGMMQALLSGRIRLIHSVKADTADKEQKESAHAGHNWVINEAVVISALAAKFGSRKFPLGRMRYTKLSYLMHRHVEKQAEGYLKKAAGPYNPETRYKGPEAIAQKNCYIEAVQSDKLTGFIAARNIDKALDYFNKWYSSEVLAWLEQFRYEKNESLELLATVDMASQDLQANGKKITVEAVKNVLRVHPEWRPKLKREIFSDAHIEQAMTKCQELFG